MADDVTVLLRRALIAALQADTDVAALATGGVVSRPRADIALPYVRLDRFEAAPWDTHDTIGYRIVFAAEVHGRGASVPVMNLAGAVRAALHRAPGDVAVAGFDVLEIEFQTGLFEPEGADGDLIVRMALEATLEPL